MDSRRSNWGGWFAEQAELDSGNQEWLPTRKVMDAQTQLQALWQQSAELRRHAIDVQAASMEVRARSRDLRLRRSGYNLRMFEESGEA